MPSENKDIETLAQKILLHSRRRITSIAPVLLECIYALKETVSPLPGPLFTDGRHLFYCPQQVVEDFRTDRDAVARQILHVTLHCLLRHTDLRADFSNTGAFDCAADIKAAQFAEAVCGISFAVNHRYSSHPRSYQEHGHLRPLYAGLADCEAETYLLSARRSARFDDHALWSLPPEQPDVPGGGRGESSSDACPNWDAIRYALLDQAGDLPGVCAGAMKETLSIQDRGLSYWEFLRHFAFPSERMLLDPDTFDPRWYHLGLEYYGDIPLLEPSEISEPPLPDDLVIALDTSGSCDGEVCQRFLKETLGILQDLSAGANRFRVLLMQCDTKIQQEVLLESPEQVDALFENFAARGFGGTDFRPVFRRVEQRRAEGTLPRVRGLLYLTDGYGEYPSTPTDYPTVFLIPEEDRCSDCEQEAPWATRLYLNENDFTLKEADTP